MLVRIKTAEVIRSSYYPIYEAKETFHQDYYEFTFLKGFYFYDEEIGSGEGPEAYFGPYESLAECLKAQAKRFKSVQSL